MTSSVYHLKLIFQKKTAKVIPIIKKRDQQDCSNYRLISLLPVIFLKLGFTLCKVEQPLQGMELQWKEAQKG